ncbi:MAG: DNA mismatch endonuclease Vsr [Amaricoccus sp.]|nr:DNA mismatch endonuclease Vsr [Amaricoccus sp.]
MRAVRQSDTRPEMILRRALFARGARFRLHRRDLPGTPDLVLPGRRLAIFVHGCFWHGHDCRAGKPPATRQDYWLPKLAENRRRDVRKAEELAALGWRMEVVWECELKRAGGPGAACERLIGHRAHSSGSAAPQTMPSS